MTWIRTLPGFAAALLALGLAVLGEGWWLTASCRNARAAGAALDRKRREAEVLARAVPAPTSANGLKLEAELAREKQRLEELRSEFRGRGPEAERLRAARPPVRSSDAFFDLVTFVDDMRERARSAGVGLKADEYFGFAEYRRAGPETALIPTVFRDRQFAGYLLGALFQARPRALISIRRERPRGASRTAASATDYFDFETETPAPGGSRSIHGRGFRLTFTGHTDTLRLLLNRLSGFDLPVIARAVEVEPAAASRKSMRAGARTASEGAPAIPRSLSRFTVTVECLDLEPAIAAMPQR